MLDGALLGSTPSVVALELEAPEAPASLVCALVLPTEGVLIELRRALPSTVRFPAEDVSMLLHTLALQALGVVDADHVSMNVVLASPCSLELRVALGVLPSALHASDSEAWPPVEAGPILVVPIRESQGPLGSMRLARHTDATGFSERDERVVRYLASQIAAAVAAARVYADGNLGGLWLQNAIEQLPTGVLLYDRRGELSAMNQSSASVR